MEKLVIMIGKVYRENKVLIMKNHGLLTVGETAGESFMNMYYAVRMCEVATQAQSSGLKLETSTKKLWEKSQKQYDAFSHVML